MATNLQLSPELLERARGKTAIITGAANGIGAATAQLYNSYGSNVVIADLPSCHLSAATLIRSLPYPNAAVFLPVDVLDWAQMTSLFKMAIRRFGGIDIVVANAGIMETEPVLAEKLLENGDLAESDEAWKIIDVNLKGTLNTLRLALHYMGSSEPANDKAIVLLASTSGYFGGSGVTAYVASKHGVVGLMRASLGAAQERGVRLNLIAPFFTHSHITSSYADDWVKAGLDANQPEDVAKVIAQVSLDEDRTGNGVLVAGKIVRELELTRKEVISSWIGEDWADFMTAGHRFFEEQGGYPLPKQRVKSKS